MSDFIHRPQIEVLSAADGVRRRQWSDEDKLRIVEESFVGHRTVHDSPGSGGLIGPSRACTDPGIECLAGLMDDPVAQSIETSSEP